MKIIAVQGSRGGSGKGTLSRLIALGAAKEGVQVVMLATDGSRSAQVDDPNRPFAIADATPPVNDPTDFTKLTNIFNQYLNAYQHEKVLMVIDGAASQAMTDFWIAEHVDIAIICVLADADSVRCLERTWSGFEKAQYRMIALNQVVNSEGWRNDSAMYIEKFPVKPSIQIPLHRQFVHLSDDVWRNDSNVNRAARRIFISLEPRLGWSTVAEAKEKIAALEPAKIN